MATTTLTTTTTTATAIAENPIQRTLESVKACRTIFSDIFSLRKANQYIPPIYRQHYFVLLLIELNLAKALDFVHHGGSKEDIELAKKISNVVEAIDVKISDLTKIVQQVRGSLKTSKWKAMFSSGTITWREIKVSSIGDQLMTCQVLLLRAGAPPLTADEIAEILKTTGISMDWRVQEHVTDLKAYQRGSISGPSGKASEMAGLTPTASTVRRPSAFYNVYDARIIGTLETDIGPVPQVIEGITPKALTSAEQILQRTISRPGPAALQFESPHLNGLILTTSVPEINLSVPEGDPARSGSINSSQLPPPANPDEALRRAMREIRNAKLDSTTYPAVSLQVYRKAIRILDSIPNSGPSITDTILFYKVHYATITEIGLSRIDTPPTPHLTKALKHNERASTLAEKLSIPRLTARATLDRAQIRSRTAQIQERTGLASKSTIRASVADSYALFSTAAELMQANAGEQCQGMGDYHVLAQALLGCGKQAKQLHATTSHTKSGSIGGKRFSLTPSSHSSAAAASKNTVHPKKTAQEYFTEAIEVVEQGLAVGQVEEEPEEALEEFALVSQDAQQQLAYLLH